MTGKRGNPEIPPKREKTENRGKPGKRESAEKGGPSPAPPGAPFYYEPCAEQPHCLKETVMFISIPSISRIPLGTNFGPILAYFGPPPGGLGNQEIAKSQNAEKGGISWNLLNLQEIYVISQNYRHFK